MYLGDTDRTGDVQMNTNGDKIFFPMALRPNADRGLLIHEVSKLHTTTHHSR